MGNVSKTHHPTKEQITTGGQPWVLNAARNATAEDVP